MNIPLTKINFTDEQIEEVKKVIKSGWITYGKVTEEFERAVAKYTGAQYAVAVSSGTTALHLALHAVGVTQNDEVVCPSFSFIASANSIVHCCAKPVFVDINPHTYNMDENKLESVISKKTKAILVVHQFGLPCNMEKINAFAHKYNLPLIEDAACALGSMYKGKKIGDGVNIACFSFHPRKIITTGEGGMLVTNNEAVFKLAKSLSLHGTALNNEKEIYSIGPSFTQVGYNYKLTDIAAALGISQLKIIDSLINERNAIARKYNGAFKKINKLFIVSAEDDVTWNYQSYILNIQGIDKTTRDTIIETLNKRGIGAKITIPPIHHQQAYRNISSEVCLPHTEQAFYSSILLPLYPQMNDSEVAYVIDNTIDVIQKVQKI